MPSPITGVWELVSETEKALMINAETHYGMVFELQQGRRGLAGPYRIEGNHIHATRLVDTTPDAPKSATFAFQRDGDTLTTTLLAAGPTSPAGHVFTWKKVSDLQMTSPFSGVWQLISETDNALNIRTDTHWINVAERGDFRRGIAGTYTAQGNRLNHQILFASDTNAPSHLELAFQREGDILTATRLSEGTPLTVGQSDQWRKID